MVGGLDLKDGEVRLRIPAGDRGRDGFSVGEQDLNRAAVGGDGNHVIVRQDVAVRPDYFP
jgi:hypothetical protein